MFGQRFEPKQIAVMCRAYQRALDERGRCDREHLAKIVITLAAVGVEDEDDLVRLTLRRMMSSRRQRERS